MALGLFTTSIETALESLGLQVGVRNRLNLSPTAKSKFFELIIIDFFARLAGFIFVNLYFVNKIFKIRYPILIIRKNSIIFPIALFSLLCAFIELILVISGYVGFFRNPIYSVEPPAWLDIIQKFIKLGFGMYFVVVIVALQNKRLGLAVPLLLAIWVTSGFLAGFKNQVIFPIFAFAAAGWLIGRFKWRYAAGSLLALVIAYNVIEPLREYRSWQGSEVNVTDAYANILNDSTSIKYGTSNVVTLFIARIDSSENGFRALELLDYGGLQDYKVRLDEIHSNWLPMAFVPRLFWSDKPLANLGQVLYKEFYGQEVDSSETIQPQVSLYVWSGIIPVVIFGFVNGIIISFASILLYLSIRSISYSFPIFIFAIYISIGNDYQVFYLIGVLRSALALWIVSSIGSKLGWIKWVYPPHASGLIPTFGASAARQR